MIFPAGRYIKPLSAQCDYKVKKPPISHFTKKLMLKRSLFFAKINHGFWQMLNGDRKFDKKLQKRLHADGLINEVISIIENINDSKMILGVSHMGPPQLPNLYPAKEIIERIRKHVPVNYVPYYAPIWKEAALDGTINNFYKAMKKGKTIVVGLSHLKTLQSKGFLHYEINLDASKDRYRILNDLIRIRNSISDYCVFLLQAGELVSTWLIHHLQNTVRHCSVIDIGRALDAIVPKEMLVLKKADAWGEGVFSDLNNQSWIKYGEQ